MQQNRPRHIRQNADCTKRTHSNDTAMDDPFDQVADDTIEQVDRLREYLASHGRDSEVDEVLRDIDDTMGDLERSIVVMKRSGQDVALREAKLQGIRADVLALKNQSGPSDADEPQPAPGSTEDPSGGLANPFQAQILQEQDEHLDSIHKTMQTLHLHAQTMGQELEDQGQLLDELDENFDSLTNKVQRGRRQLEWVYENNKEKVNDCCIGLLIVALIVLLVLAFIA